ncbi:MAG: arginine decarboxylase, partial [Verrucomicrobia bacterium]|nr:arginine decarboxylase [Verrucomicrobiota bacterium]
MIPPASAAAAPKTAKRKVRTAWTAEQSADLYGVDSWGHGFFGVNRKGHLTVRLEDAEAAKEVSLFEVIAGLHERGTHLPV